VSKSAQHRRHLLCYIVGLDVVELKSSPSTTSEFDLMTRITIDEEWVLKMGLFDAAIQINRQRFTCKCKGDSSANKNTD